MDLRNMLNEGSGQAPAAHAAAAAPGKPQPPRPASQHHQQHPQNHAPPSTPVQAGPPHPFHDHHQAIQPSPVRAVSHDLHPARQTPFASPPPYSASTSYATSARAPSHPLQQLSTTNVRSPSAGPAHVPPSPYARTTPAGSSRADSTGYPFPSPGQPHADSASPVQAHRYPPSTAYASRDSYPPPSGPMPSPGPSGYPPNYNPGQQPIPHASPVGTPGAGHPYMAQQHQRSASVQSQQTYPPQPFASPVAVNHPPPPSDRLRQPSQPPTPLGPPLTTGPRQPAGPASFAQPSSPYQQRAPSSGAPYPPYPSQQSQQQQQQQQKQQQQQLHQQHSNQRQQQPSPHIPPRPQSGSHPPIQRNPSAYEQPPPHPHAVDPQRRSLSYSERERSVSVSPKTRVPSLPSSAGHHSQASISGPSGQAAETEPREPRHQSSSSLQMRDAPGKLEREAPVAAARPERVATPAKRKMDDRDMRPEDVERQERRPAPFDVNGTHRLASSHPPAPRPSPNSSMPRRRKARHAGPPSWAQPYDRQQLKNPNYALRKSALMHPHVNGKSEPPRPEQNMSPEAPRSSVLGPSPSQAPQPVPGPPKPKFLGPWEVTVANQAPMDEMIRTVADFLFMLVVNGDLGDIHGQHGIQYEIEAKLGTLIDRSQAGTVRFQLPVESEVVLSNNPAVAFTSSMTEAQHKAYNDYLNRLVAEASPQNPANKVNPESRVAINYVHLRETDRFYKLTRAAQSNVHPVLHHLMGNKTPSVRVTTEKTTGRVVNKIIKTNIAQLHILFPQCDLDCRISVNIEANYDGPIEELEQVAQEGGARGDKSDRHKDRLSYTQGNYRVDLTQVTQPETGVPNAQNTKKTHELEIELNADAVIDQGRRAMRGEPHNYEFLIEGFVNNIRLLARKARDFAAHQ